MKICPQYVTQDLREKEIDQKMRFLVTDANLSCYKKNWNTIAKKIGFNERTGNLCRETLGINPARQKLRQKHPDQHAKTLPHTYTNTYN